MKLTINLSCFMWDDPNEGPAVEVELPEGWSTDTERDIETALCPAHAPIRRFLSAQCPGCVSSFEDPCLLRKSWEPRAEVPYGETDRAMVRQGICPRRLNGTMSRGALRSIDLSDAADAEASACFADAIDRYRAKAFEAHKRWYT